MPPKLGSTSMTDLKHLYNGTLIHIFKVKFTFATRRFHVLILISVATCTSTEATPQFCEKIVPETKASQSVILMLLSLL